MEGGVLPKKKKVLIPSFLPFLQAALLQRQAHKYPDISWSHDIATAADICIDTQVKIIIWNN